VVLVQEQTNQDYNNQDIVLEWKPDEARPAQRQTGTVPIWLPSQSLEFSKLLDANPAPMGKTFVGRTNSDTFQGDPAGYWLCMGLRFSSPDGGVHWDTSLKVARNERMWQEKAYYVAENGRPPANWDAAYNVDKTVKLIQIYGSVAFSGLGVPDVMSITA
jgi:hypothetical protein